MISGAGSISRAENRVRTIRGIIPPEQLAEIGGARYLDIGGGEGSITRAIIDAFGIEDYLIAEPDERLTATDGRFVNSSGGLLPGIEDNSVGLVTAYMSFHHILGPDLARILSEIARVLRPGGILVVREHDVPADTNLQAILEWIHFAYHVNETTSYDDYLARAGVHYMSLEDLEQALTGIGFQRIGIDQEGGTQRIWTGAYLYSQTDNPRIAPPPTTNLYDYPDRLLDLWYAADDPTKNSIAVRVSRILGLGVRAIRQAISSVLTDEQMYKRLKRVPTRSRRVITPGGSAAAE